MSIFGDEFDSAFVQEEYNKYLTDHIGYVKDGYQWLRDNIPSLVIGNKYETSIYENIMTHDKSKYSEAEYFPYANYFYRQKVTDEMKVDFDYAWNHHQKTNPHHWQYWVLINDEDGIKCLDIPYAYIVEMFCDHWAFSWKKGNLREIVDWYGSNKDKIYFSEKTKETYETILNAVMKRLDAIDREQELKFFGK